MGLAQEGSILADILRRAITAINPSPASSREKVSGSGTGGITTRFGCVGLTQKLTEWSLVVGSEFNQRNAVVSAPLLAALPLFARKDPESNP